MVMLRAQDKSPDAFRTISEVATELDVPQHVLRFWESKFGAVKPLKRGGGRRYYRPDDLDLLRGIRTLLYREGITIRGVQKILREQGVRYVMEMGRGLTRLMDARSLRVVATASPLLPKPISPAHELSRGSEPSFGLAGAERARIAELLDELLDLKAQLKAARRVARVLPH
jgi:DNA-binding transcriptional MerR regulator